MVLNFTHPLEISESLTTKNKKIESLLIQNNNLKKIINNLNNKLNNSDTFKMIKKLESDYQTIINTRTALHKQLDEYVSTIDYQNKEITMLAEQRNSALKEVTFYKKQIKELNSDNNTSQKYHYIEKFTKKIKYLKEQIKKLKYDNNTLQFENTTNKNYETQYNNLNSENETTVFELNEKKIENEEQQTMISNLKIFNNSLEHKLNDTIQANIDLKQQNHYITTKYNNIMNEYFQMDKFIQTQDKDISEQKKTNDQLLESQTKLQQQLEYNLDKTQEVKKEIELHQTQEVKKEIELQQTQESDTDFEFELEDNDFYLIDFDEE